jgi:hypothetical protein
MIGKLYTAVYDAKHKDTLEYWDKNPMFMPVKYINGNILSINFHYLPPKMRQKLMTMLMEYSNNDKMDETTKLKLSYNMLQAASKLKMIKPTLHSYIPGRFKSKIVEIPANLWSTAMILPTQKFVGATASQVYKDSTRNSK